MYLTPDVAYDAVTVMRRHLLPVACISRSATDLIGDDAARLELSSAALTSTNKVSAPSSTEVPPSSSVQDIWKGGESTAVAGTGHLSSVSVASLQRGGRNWVSTALEVLGAAQDHTGSDNQAFVRTAEMLIPHLATLSPSRRPQLTLSDDGRPSFGASTATFYLDLTIESPNKLTWYAVVNGREYFAEDVAFEGRRLPEDLRRVFEVRS